MSAGIVSSKFNLVNAACAIMLSVAPSACAGVANAAQPAANEAPVKPVDSESTEIFVGGCAEDLVKGADGRKIALVVCRFAASDDIRLFLNDTHGKPFGHFNWVNEALAKDGETLVFAMNAGMYHQDRAPVGLYIEDRVDVTPLNDRDGPGNFHLKPNGVFWTGNYPGSVGRDAFVATADAFMEQAQMINSATQSGPMLVIDGELHPRFLADSTSRKRRNGVGVTEDGAVIFVLADTPVTFHEFGSFFRDTLKTPNALYLDGTISRLYAPGLGRNDPGVAMGPIVGVVSKLNSEERDQ